MKTKTKKIVFRVESSLFDFIGQFAKSNGMTMSEFIRNVLIRFHMDYFLGNIDKPLPELEEDFWRVFKNKTSIKNYYKKKKVKSLAKVIK